MRKMVLVVSLMLVMALSVVGGTAFGQEREGADYANINRLINMDPESEGTFEDYMELHPPSPYASKMVEIGPMPVGDGLKVLVMINSGLRPSIETELQRYLGDLENNDYAPVLIEVSGGTPADVKATILANSADLIGVVFVGDIPVAWFENYNDFDGNYASFPCDYFYMDLDGTWQDADANGQYDSFSAGSGDEEPEIYLGRISAERMSADEVTLTKYYFDKLHNFYIGVLYGPDYGLTYVEDDWQYYSDINNDIGGAYPNYQNIAGTSTPIHTERDDYLYNRLKSKTYEYIQLCCHSGSGGCYFTRGGLLSSSTVIAEKPQALFYNFFNCSGARFTDTNYFGGAHIFNMSPMSIGGVGSTKTGSMLSFWAYYDPLGEEKSHGQAFKEWFAFIAPFSLGELQWHFGMTLVGDPFVVPKKTYRQYGPAESGYPKFQYDSQNSGFVPGAPSLEQPAVDWQFPLAGAVAEQRSSPVIAEDGTIYVGSADGAAPGLYAINPDGSSKWYFASDAVLSTPSIDVEGNIYFATWNGTDSGNQVYCLRDYGTSASVVWQVNSDDGDNVLTSIALSDTSECLYGTGVADGQMIAVNAYDGAEKWKQPALGGIGGSPALTRNNDLAVFVSSENKMVHLLNTRAGDVCDTYETDAFMWAPTPCIGEDDTVYVGDDSGKVYAFDISGNTLALKWSSDISGSINGGLGAVYEKGGKNRLYVVDNGGGRLVALRDDVSTGTVLWSYDIGAGGSTYNTANVVFKGIIYVGSTETDKLYSLKDMDTHGELVWEISAGDPSKRLTGKGMAIGGDGTIYCNSEDGNLYAIHETAVPSVRVTYPNGGEMLMVGSTQTIRWETTGGIMNVMIELYKGGAQVATIAESALNLGEFEWEIPGTQAIDEDYQIKITDLDHAGVSDLSDDYFMIASGLYYFVSLDGSDETGTGRPDNPWRTIQHALINVASGSAVQRAVIHVGEGVFVEHAAGEADSPDGVIFPYAGNPYGWGPKNYVEIRGAGMDKTIISTDASNQSAGGEAKIIYMNGSGNVIRDLTIRHGIPQTGEWGSGVYCETGKCQNNLAANVRIDNVGSIGICARDLDSGQSDAVHVQNVLCHQPGFAGIYSSGSDNTCIPSNLTVVDGKKGGGTGCGIIAAAAVDVSYSIFANNSSALKTIGSGTIHSLYNDFWQNDVDYDEGQAGSIPVRLDDMFSDPAFFNPYGLEYFSFFLKDGSPAEGKGFAPDTIVDSDGDGMPDFWEDLFGFDRWNPADANGDYDLDGKTNLDEYLAGTDPTDEGSIFEVMDVGWDSGAGVPTIEWSSVPGMFYAVLSSSGPLGGSMSWVAEIEDIRPTEGSTSSWTDTGFGATSEKYYSVEVYGR